MRHPPNSCAPGWGHCTSNATDGCETNFHLSESCGSCSTVCPNANPICAVVEGEPVCATACQSSQPDFCGQCVNLDGDLNFCGACDVDCALDHASAACIQG